MKTTLIIIAAIAVVLFSGNSFAATNINGFAQQLQQANDVTVYSKSGENMVVGSQVVHSTGELNVNAIEQTLIANNISVHAVDAENSVIGAQVIASKGHLNINNSVKQIMLSHSILVAQNGGENSVVGAQVIASH